MTQKQIPGPKSREWLERGIPLFRDGLRFRKDLEKAASQGFDVANQIIVDRAAGDFVWDVDGRRHINFQNGWATNPVGNANPEIIDAVDAAEAAVHLALTKKQRRYVIYTVGGVGLDDPERMRRFNELTHRATDQLRNQIDSDYGRRKQRRKSFGN